MKQNIRKIITGKPFLRWTFLRWMGIPVIFFLFLCIPPPQFHKPLSTVIFDNNGSLLGAHIAEDGQWRFPAPTHLPEKYKTALLTFEDEYFYYHPGINPWSLFRATFQNIKHNRIMSGGSTLTMQVARMSADAPRTIGNKLLEMVKALRLELGHSKEEILLIYAANAPFGGNIVGFETASWHYFKRPPQHLTWAEAALLAVLPNAPGLLRPGHNSNTLKKKRDGLLKKLLKNGHITTSEFNLSLHEPLPPGTRSLPSLAPHLVDYYLNTRKGEMITTTLNAQLQKQAKDAMQRHSDQMASNHIRHAGAIIADVETGHVLAYIGNSAPRKDKTGHAVDMIRAQRSSGSILKPILYADALQEGTILPQSLLPDVPTQYQGYTPSNFHRKYDGAVAADDALSRSLNIPFVRLLHRHGAEKFLKKLNMAGITTMDKGYEHYGLSLILGGGEVTLWELAGTYASMGRTLKHYVEDNSNYRSNDFHPLLLEHSDTDQIQTTDHPPVFSAGAIWWTLEAMKSVIRPPEEAGWEHFSSGQNIAWKTGTSYGFRDAWSIGVSGRYVVGVWVGNASGEGRAGLLGGLTAGPLMFRLFDLLPTSPWYEVPHDDLKEQQVCKKSGFRASPICPETEKILIPHTIKSNPVCPYHQLIHLTPDRQFQTRKSCEPEGKIISEPWFVLPPLMAWYYSRQKPGYRFLPPEKPGCFESENTPMDFIYPPPGATIIRPIDFDGEQEKLVFKVVHSNPKAIIFWHLDQDYLGKTKDFHEMELEPEEGQHLLTLVDDKGNKTIRKFTIKK